MNTAELKAERIRKGKGSKEMAELIGKTYDAYAKKERGEVKFDLEEVVVVTHDLGLNFEKFNAIFFDGKLPFSKNEFENGTLVT